MIYQEVKLADPEKYRDRGISNPGGQAFGWKEGAFSYGTRKKHGIVIHRYKFTNKIKNFKRSLL